ncbi:MAG: hypothetical protein FJ253_05470 [Phycisphaerae bacterium]|nr:hypothetical protein [Phycisphaerae bacterium]
MASNFKISASRNPTAASLFGVAAIQGIVILLILGAGRSFGDHWISILVVMSWLIYGVLGVAAFWNRLVPALTGAGLYAAFLIHQGVQSLDLMLTGLVFKVPNVLLLIVAVVGALVHASSTAGSRLGATE